MIANISVAIYFAINIFAPLGIFIFIQEKKKKNLLSV